MDFSFKIFKNTEFSILVMIEQNSQKKVSAATATTTQEIKKGKRTFVEISTDSFTWAHPKWTFAWPNFISKGPPLSITN